METVAPDFISSLDGSASAIVNDALAHLNQQGALVPSDCTGQARIDYLASIPSVRGAVAALQMAGVPFWALARYCPDAAITTAEAEAILARFASIQLGRVFLHLTGAVRGSVL